MTFRSLDETQEACLPPRIQKIVCSCIEDLLDAVYSQNTTDQNAHDLFGRTWTDARSILVSGQSCLPN